MQKENKFFFSFPRRSIFGEAKDIEKPREMQKENKFFFSFPRRSIFGEAKDIEKIENMVPKSKKNSIFAQ